MPRAEAKAVSEPTESRMSKEFWRTPNGAKPSVARSGAPKKVEMYGISAASSPIDSGSEMMPPHGMAL